MFLKLLIIPLIIFAIFTSVIVLSFDLTIGMVEAFRLAVAKLRIDHLYSDVASYVTISIGAGTTVPIEGVFCTTFYHMFC
ncbi:MAG: hypothetical protein HQK84_00625 [Nitrospinae bacterium]|nr:hypothetical protein [Nitrospinota bacterium]